MAAAVAGRPAVPLAVIFLVGATVALAIPAIVPRTDGHAEKHAFDRVTTEAITAAVQGRTCVRVEAYASAKFNTILVLCDIQGTTLVGGLIMGATTGHELTAFAAPREHWAKVIQRDGYVPIGVQ